MASVALAFTVPLASADRDGKTIFLSKTMEQDLHCWVAFMMLPLFAFVNAGVDLRGISLAQMGGNVPLGIMLGLFIRKQAGVFGFSWLAIKLKLVLISNGSSWRQLCEVTALTGIGFTMSLFIDSLAFEDDMVYQYADKLAVLVGSSLSGLADM